MNRVFQIITLIVAIALISICNTITYSQEREMELAKHLSIHLTSEPSGAQVFYQDSLLGITPIDLPLSRAWGQLRFIYPSVNNWNAVEKDIEISLEKNYQGIVRVVLPYKVVINSIPYGAEVVKGDSVLGVTPLIYTSDDDISSLMIRKVNYEKAIIEIHRSNVQPINVALKKISFQLEEQFVTQHQTTFRLPKTNVIIAASVGLLSGITSVALKTHANNIYDDYRATGNNDLLSQTRRYDMYSGVTHFILQASLAYLTYLLLSGE